MIPNIVGAHPLAEEWPIREDVLEEITDSIRLNGQRHPIVVTPGGLIVDGRTRYQACLALGIHPDVVVYGGDDILEYVLDANAGRRHESAGVRALIVARSLISAGRREGGKFAYGEVRNGKSFTKSFQVQVSNAASIIDYAPELADEVISKSLSFDAAYREAESRRDSERSLLEEQERIAAEDEAYREHLESVAPEYLDKYKTARQAFAAWEDDNREAAAKERRAKSEREAAEARRRKDLSHTFTTIFETFMSVGSYTAPIEKIMADYHPSLLAPPKLARYGEVEHIEKGIKFLTDYIEWKKAQNA